MPYVHGLLPFASCRPHWTETGRVNLGESGMLVCSEEGSWALKDLETSARSANPLHQATIPARFWLRQQLKHSHNTPRGVFRGALQSPEEGNLASPNVDDIHQV